MGGKTELEAVLAQVRAVTHKEAHGVVVLTSEQEAALNELQAGARRIKAPVQTPGEAYQATYHSNEIIQVLEDLLKTFTQEKNKLDQMELESKEVFDKEVLGLENQAKFAGMEK